MYLNFLIYKWRLEVRMSLMIYMYKISIVLLHHYWKFELLEFLLKINPSLKCTEISQPSCLYFLIAEAYSYPPACARYYMTFDTNCLEIPFLFSPHTTPIFPTNLPKFPTDVPKFPHIQVTTRGENVTYDLHVQDIYCFTASLLKVWIARIPTQN